MTSNSSTQRTILASAIAALFSGGIGANALAQEAAQEDVAPLEEIMVTGSRIQRSGFVTPVPVTSVSMGELRDMEPSSTLAERLDQLPQFFMTNSAQRGGHTVVGAGQSHLNMRGVGINRTLVLLDGSRVVPSDRLSSVNVDYLPSALMRDVEVVTGGASAAYGADALAGVTNFLLDREFTGIRGNMQGGITQFGDGENWQAELAFGGSVTDRLHVIGSVEARKVNDIQRGASPARVDEVRWLRDNWGLVTNPEWSADDPPGTNVRLIPAPNVHSTLQSPAGLIRQPGFEYHLHTFTVDGQSTRRYQYGEYATFGMGQNNQSGGPEYHTARMSSPTGPSRNEVVQRSGFLGFDYDFNDDVTLWGHAIFGRIESNSPGDLAFIGQNGIWPITLFRENPFLPAHIVEAMDNEGRDRIRIDTAAAWGCANPREECKPSRHLNVHDMYSVTLGIDAELPRGWRVRANYQIGEADKNGTMQNWVRLDRLFLAMDTVDDPELGLVCNIQTYARDNPNLVQDLHEWARENTMVNRFDAGRQQAGVPEPIDYPIGVPDGTIENCVPLNPLGVGTMTPEAWRYVHTDKRIYSAVTQHFAEVLFTGMLHEGWGAGPIDQAVGLTYREESMDQGKPAADLPIDSLGPPFNVPELGIRGIPPAFETGGPALHRFSTYPTFSGRFDVWEIYSETNIPLFTSATGDQRVSTNLAARYAEYARAGEVWSWKAGLDFQVTQDVRLRTTYSRDVREGSFSEMFDFQSGGVNVLDPATSEVYLITSFNMGNEEIAPEKADTLVAGIVYQPSQLPGLQLSADWYDIDLSSAIGQLGPQRLIDECFNNDVYCEFVDRSDGTGRLERVRNPYLNINDARVSGVDTELAYRLVPNLFEGSTEDFTLRLLVGYLRENSSTPLGGSREDQAGDMSRPKWTGTAWLGYRVGPVGVNVQQRYIHRTIQDLNWVEGVDVARNRVPSAAYTSLRLSYTRDQPAGSWTASLNVQNLFDRDHPILPGTGGQVTNNTFDLLGRRYTAALQFRY